MVKNRKADDTAPLEAFVETTTREDNENISQANGGIACKQRRKKKKIRVGEKCPAGWNNYGITKTTNIAQTNTTTVSQTENSTKKLSKGARKRKRRRERKEQERSEQLLKSYRNINNGNEGNNSENQILDDFLEPIVPALNNLVKAAAPKNNGDEEPKKATTKSPEIIDLLDDDSEPIVPAISEQANGVTRRRTGNKKPKKAPTNGQEVINLLDDDLEPKILGLKNNADKTAQTASGSENVDNLIIENNTNKCGGIGVNIAARQRSDVEKIQFNPSTNKSNLDDGTKTIIPNGVAPREVNNSGSDSKVNNNQHNIRTIKSGNKNFNDRDISNREGTKSSIIFLEEQVKINESTLRAWRRRRDDILVEKETTLAKKRELMDLRANLIDRQTGLQTARTKHLALQVELKESLAMSRERLKQLTMLEKEAEIENVEPKETIIEMADFASSDTSFENSEKENMNEIDQEDGNVVELSNAKNISSIDQKESPFLLLFANQTVKDLTWHHMAGVRFQPSLSGFLPYLDATQVGDYLTIMLRETYALDHATCSNVKGNDREKSFRRLLLQNTCLDVLLLVPPEKNDGRRNFGTAAYSNSTHHLFDPNLSLCPYELQGKCTDDFCPYQHTTKATKFLARERLPLPSLSSFLSAGPLVEPRSKSKEKPKKDQEKKFSFHRTNVEIEQAYRNQSIPKPDQDIELANKSDNTSDEEDFIMLPPASPLNFEDDDNDDDSDSDAVNNEDSKRREESDDELALSSTRGKVLKHKSSEISTFWWGGKLPVYQNNRVKDLVPKDSSKAALSIYDILEDTFGLIVHKFPKIEAAGAEDISSNTGKRLEIRSTCGSDPENPNDIQFIDEMKILGRLVDATRMILHGGLHDIAVTISGVLLGGTLLKHQSVRLFTSLLHDQMELSLVDEKAAPTLSCFETTFITQVGLSILSLSIADYGEAEEKRKGNNHSPTHALNLACKTCWRILKNPERSTSANNAIEPFDMTQLKKFLKKDCYNVEDVENDRIQHKIICNEIDNSAKSNVTTKVVYLKTLILTAQKNLIPYRDNLIAAEEPLEERLSSIWLVAKNFLREHRDVKLKNSKESSLNSSLEEIDGALDWEFQCLKIVILMGYTVIGCLTNLATAAATVFVEPDAGDEEWLGSELPNTNSNTAAWTLLDGTIARVLKEMRGCLAGFPLLDVIMAPLWASSVASATYLRSYSTAQNRLTDCLKGQYRRLDSTDDYPSTNVMAFSELLWSQLVQLRMSLPNESLNSMKAMSILANKSIPKSNKLLQTSKDSSNDFPREISKALKEENRRFVAKLESLNICLCHVVLWGDWMLSYAVEKNSSQTLLRLYSRDQNGTSKLSKKRDDSAHSSASIVWRDDLLKVRKQSFGSHQYPPPSPLPCLPLILLHAGKFLTHLDLKGCFLEKLPLAFGLSFPSLRKLDLSGNRLRELPESLRRVTNRMKFLEEFYACNNLLDSLPSDMLLSSSSSSSKQSSPLRILALSHNKLGSVPSLVGLHQLEVLELHHNALVDMTMADWSRLALRLPSLRILECEHQAAHHLPSRKDSDR